MTEVLPASPLNSEQNPDHTHDEHLRGVDLSRRQATPLDLADVAFNAHLNNYGEDRDGITVIPAAE